MRLAVLTDTHVGSVQELPGLMRKALADADLIVHAGDFTEAAVLEGLRAFKEVKAVCGNMDSPAIQMALPRKELFVAAGKKIGLIHGYGPPKDLMETVRKEFSGVDCIVFGHTHRPVCHRLYETMFINPGSFLGSGRYGAPGTYAILEAGETITGLITATALVQPDKKLASVKPQSVVKRMKEKAFAASVSRENIRECEKIGIPLEEFVELSLKAMGEISDRLGL